MKTSLRALNAVNFFMADVQGGLGPFLGIYLQAKQWLLRLRRHNSQNSARTVVGDQTARAAVMITGLRLTGGVGAQRIVDQRLAERPDGTRNAVRTGNDRIECVEDPVAVFI